MGHKFAAIFKH